MSDTKRISHAAMSPAEREFRSRLMQLVRERGLLSGTLLERRRVCGKSSCRCARGHLHESLYLVIREDGRTRQICVPKAWEEKVRRWVEEYHRAQDLLKEISRIHWDKVRKRRD